MSNRHVKPDICANCYPGLYSEPNRRLLGDFQLLKWTVKVIGDVLANVPLT
jgi:hypothetical protein